jgi:outer membrane protein OmpA-like peptidoglycan-associated protein/outer membrane protein W
MKKITKVFILMVLIPSFALAQNEDNSWQLTVGLNAVDVFPVGEAAPQGELFSEFFKVSEHWNIMPSLSTLSLSKYIGNNMSLGLTGSINRIEKWGDANVDDLMYYGIDANFKYSLAKLIKSKRFEPFVGIGGGYSWIQEGEYNNNNVGKSNAKIGALTANGTLGLSHWFSQNIGLTISTTYKHSFDLDLTKHFQHNLGLSINFDRTKEAPEFVEEVMPEVIPDTDGDGVNDNLDRCPMLSGIASNNGCPPEPVDVDSDGDGFLDSVDECPEIIGVASYNGCPLPDLDQDGIEDSADKCPEVPGLESNDGCPYEEVIVGDRNTNLNMLSKQILFDTSKSSFKQEAGAVLIEIVQIMNQHPEAQFKLEGHTDSTGASNMNQKLSESRVNAVKEYLIENGIPSTNLTTEAYGESSPMASNATKEGRKQNRRVEVIRIK